MTTRNYDVWGIDKFLNKKEKRKSPVQYYNQTEKWKSIQFTPFLALLKTKMQPARYFQAYLIWVSGDIYGACGWVYKDFNQ